MDSLEQNLIELSQSGDAEAFEKLISPYMKSAYNLAYRYMGNSQDAEDASQDALISVFKNIKSFRGDSSFSTWMYRIVINTCKNYKRSDQKRSGDISIDKELETEDGSMKIDLADFSENPESKSLQKLKTKSLMDAIELLSDDKREILVMRDLQGMGYDEISEILDVALGTVKSRLNRARAELRDIIVSSSNFRELFDVHSKLSFSNEGGVVK